MRIVTEYFYNPDELENQLINCPLGNSGWSQFEEICENIFYYLFVPPLRASQSQVRTIDGRNIRDIIFPNRNIGVNDFWTRMYHQYSAYYIVIECKNYDSTDITSTQVEQLSTYLRDSRPVLGNFGLLLCSKTPNNSAIQRQIMEMSSNNNLIVFITKEDLLEMIALKRSGQSPESFIENNIDSFVFSYILRPTY